MSLTSGLCLARDFGYKTLIVYDSDLRQVYNSDDAASFELIHCGGGVGYAYVRGQTKHAFFGGASAAIPSEYHVDWMNETYIAYGSRTLKKAVIAAFDGRVVAEVTDFDGRVSGCITDTGQVLFLCENYGPHGRTVLLDEAGNKLFETRDRYIGFVPSHSLFVIRAEDCFAYMDASGDTYLEFRCWTTSPTDRFSELRRY